MTRDEFEAMIRPPLTSTVDALRRAWSAAGVRGALTAVLLVGGSSRIPLVARMVGEALGCRTVVDSHPKHAVALGAAVVAARGSGAVGGLAAARPVGADGTTRPTSPPPSPAALPVTDAPNPTVVHSPDPVAATRALPRDPAAVRAAMQAPASAPPRPGPGRGPGPPPVRVRRRPGDPQDRPGPRAASTAATTRAPPRAATPARTAVGPRAPAPVRPMPAAGIPPPGVLCRTPPGQRPPPTPGPAHPGSCRSRGPRPMPTEPGRPRRRPPDTPTIVTRMPGGADPQAGSRRTRTVVIAVVALLVLAVLVAAAVIYLR